MAIPIRTCVGCHARAPQPSLARFVSGPVGLAPDPARRAPGRGAWLHRSAACHEAFARRRGVIRSLRRAASRAERAALVAALTIGSPR